MNLNILNPLFQKKGTQNNNTNNTNLTTNVLPANQNQTQANPNLQNGGGSNSPSYSSSYSTQNYSSQKLKKPVFYGSDSDSNNHKVSFLDVQLPKKEHKYDSLKSSKFDLEGSYSVDFLGSDVSVHRSLLKKEPELIVIFNKPEPLLTILLADLKSNPEKARPADKFQQYITIQSRVQEAEKFKFWLKELLTNHIYPLLTNSQHVLSGLHALNAITTTSFSSVPTIILNYLKLSLKNEDIEILRFGSKILGRLARVGTSETNAHVEFELKRAIGWLQGNQEAKKYAGCFIIEEISINASGLLVSWVWQITDALWVTLRDLNPKLRESMVPTLRAFLLSTSKRDSLLPNQIFKKFYTEIEKGFKKGSSSEVIHASLIALRVLLQESGNFLLPNFTYLCETTIKLKDHTQKFIRRTVLELIPQLASFSPSQFKVKFLAQTCNHLFKILGKDTSERAAAFISLGQLSRSLGTLEGFLEKAVPLLKMGLSIRIINKKYELVCEEALMCTSMIISGVGLETMELYFSELEGLMFASGLSESLIKSLSKILYNSRARVHSFPYIKATCHRLRLNLLHLISNIVCGQAWNDPGTPIKFIKHTPPVFAKVEIPLPPRDSIELENLIALSLSTLGTFDFSGFTLLQFVFDSVVPLAHDPNPLIRKEAILCCFRVLLSSSENILKNFEGKICSTMETLLAIAVVDPDISIRQATLIQFENERLQQYLQYDVNINNLFISLNDESFDIRLKSLGLIGSLTFKNPAITLPRLRKLLLQLLAELSQGNLDSFSKEQSATLLKELIDTCPQAVSSYAARCFPILLPRLSDSDFTVSSTILASIGDLSEVSGSVALKWLDPDYGSAELMNYILNSFKIRKASTKREIAFHALGQLARSTGYVIKPYHQFPKLLSKLLREYREEPSLDIKREILKVVGILGALDPVTFKNQRLAIEGREELYCEANLTQQLVATTEELISPSNPDYFPSITLSTLLKILQDPHNVAANHTLVVHTIMVIVRSLGIKVVQYLSQILETFFKTIKTPETERSLRILIFQQLGQIAVCVSHHIRPELPRLFELVNESWATVEYRPALLILLQKLSMAMSDEFRLYIADAVPFVLYILRNPQEHTTLETTGKSKHPAIIALRTLDTFNNTLIHQIHFVIPPIVKLCEPPSEWQLPVAVRIEALRTLGIVCSRFYVKEWISRIIHTLIRMLSHREIDVNLQEHAIQVLVSLSTNYRAEFSPIASIAEKFIPSNHPYWTEHRELSPVNKYLQPQAPDEDEEEGIFTEPLSGKEAINEASLKKSWEIDAKVKDWKQWLRNFATQLIRQTPSAALRACIPLVNQDSSLAEQLFNPAFLSCWVELSEKSQKELTHTLEQVLSSAAPPSVLQVLLNLTEFMDRDEKALPINPIILATLAEDNHAYAKALRYNETLYKNNPQNFSIESLVNINQQLGLTEAARGLIGSHKVESASLYLKLQDWGSALTIYAKERGSYAPNSQPYQEATLGMIQCYELMGNWEKISNETKAIWSNASPAIRQQISGAAASAAWRLKEWDAFPKFIQSLERAHSRSTDAAFYRAILAIHNGDYEEAQHFVDLVREYLETDMNSLLGESYSRAYNLIVGAQQLSELEESIIYRTNPKMRPQIHEIWDKRLEGTDRSIQTWRSILSLRSLTLPPQEDQTTWIKYASLCRKNSRKDLSRQTLVETLGVDPVNPTLIGEHNPRLAFAYISHLWDSGERNTAYSQLALLAPLSRTDIALSSKIYRKLGEWEQSISGLNEQTLPSIIYSFQMALKYDQKSYKPWHTWGLAHYEAISYYEQNNMKKKMLPHLVPAVRALFRAIDIGKSTGALQESLRLLTLLFKHGNEPDMEGSFIEGINSISIDYWLQVVPQLIARIHSTSPSVRRPVHEILVRLARTHPQTLVYSLYVAKRSNYQPRVQAAATVLDKMRKHYANIVDQAEQVSSELIKVSIICHEMWHDALEEASRAYFQDHNTEGMFDVLGPLHEMIEKGSQNLTGQEKAFHQTYARDLQEAWLWCKKFMRTNKTHDLNQAWDLYYKVFRRLSKQLPSLSTLEISQVSPYLWEVRDLDLVVPGTYYPGRRQITIRSFDSSTTIIHSKQRPRKMIVNGSQGKDFLFLLKGNEDLRQDERVMQLFGLVNGLLNSNYETSKNQLSIARFSVIPLSPNSGLIGWVPHYDTMHQLIREYRDNKKIPINVEHKLMLQFAPDYDSLPTLQQVEAFQHALSSTEGDDLERILWLKSTNSEEWLDRRTNFTRSLAVMSMVGYLLGLGDRHPSNLMVDKHTGRVLHIDFGDCFEVAMHREKYPETIPFRLTRMLVNAMEVAGINGTFRSTCEATMSILRRNKESVMAVLEAFVYDPLINLRLLGPGSPQKDSSENTNNKVPTFVLKGKLEETKKNELSSSLYKRLVAPESEPEIPAFVNKRALVVINRVNSKLTGRDFGAKEIGVPEQVDLLIDQATSHENLCQCYIGWCAFW